jgi:hypothetical protein
MILTFENRAERVGICADNGLDNEGQAGTTSGGTQATLTHCQEPEKADNKLIIEGTGTRNFLAYERCQK